MDEQRQDETSGARELNDKETVSDQLVPDEADSADAAFTTGPSSSPIDPDLGTSEDDDEETVTPPPAARPAE